MAPQLSTRLFKPLHLAAWLLTMLGLIFTLPARADAGVKDEGHFFTPGALEKANTEIKKIHDDFGKELVVETYPDIPEARKADWETAKEDTKKKDDFFAKWIGERAHDLQVNGVYILIVKDPGHLEVKVGKKTKEKAFTEANQTKLRDTLLNAFKAKNFDEGLQTGVDYFRDTLKQNLGGVKHTGPSASADEQFRHTNSGTSSGSHLPTAGRPNTPAPTGSTSSTGRSIMWIILVIIAAFVIIRILSSLGNRSNSGGPGYGQGQQGPGYGGGQGYGGGGYGGGGGGGGGFFRNMLGGMLGGAAGGYMYDRFRDRNNPGGQQSQNPGTPDNSSGGDFNSSSSDDNDRGQGFGGGGSGGDFGSSGSDSSSSSGGDFGSSSSDSGGGGGDSGGGGGSGGDF